MAGRAADMETILQGKYPAKAHCRKVSAYLQSQQNLSGDGGLIYLEAQKTKLQEDSDVAAHFRQRRPFFYLSGCPLPDSYLTYDIPRDKLTLFIPPIDPDGVMWTGLPESPAEALAKYDVDEVRYTSEVNAHLASSSSAVVDGRSGSVVYAIPEQVSEHITFLAFRAVDLTHLREAIDESRVTKDDYEVALIRKANQISTVAHVAAAKAARTARNEQEIYGAFVGTSIGHGAHEQGYLSICASGHDCATLHYVQNDKPLHRQLNILLDAGAEYRCYTADITRTFPVSGRWTAESEQIYDLVGRMQAECFARCRAGVRWEDVHAHSHRVAVDGLTRIGILRGDRDDIFAKRVSVAFYPHGLGHYMGLDVHDTGGHADYDDPDSMFKYLRVRGPVPAGAVITVEPGIYFCRFLIDPVLHDPELAKYIDRDVLDRFWDVGGVRIEDDVLITDDGYENLTDTPRM